MVILLLQLVVAGFGRLVVAGFGRRGSHRGR